ncbi:MAG: Calcineurin-like phosphoesterase [Syntrophorhabdus sp. PtaB.Bin047]|nr:MAG: Calcineurin-like phosphoesterase [Syntrophorhabdus sp. PtaB.Bin047]
MADMRILYTADLHGNPDFYRKLFTLATRKKAGVVIVGGDLLPKTGEYANLINEQRRFIADTLRPLLHAFRDSNPAVDVLLMMGNDDFSINMHLLEEMEEEGLLKLLHMRVHPLAEGLSIAGYGCVRPTPFSCKDWERYDDQQKILQPGPYKPVVSTLDGLLDIDEQEWFSSHPTMQEDLEQLARMSDPKKTIYVIHDPPWNTNLDVLYGGQHIGSAAVRRFIEQHQPSAVLSGHIHESPKVSGKITDRIGETLCVNPGQTEAIFQGVMIDIPGYKVKPL